MKNNPRVKKSTLVLILTILIFISSVLTFTLSKECPTKWTGLSSTVLTAALICVCYFYSGIAKLFGYLFAKKPACPYYLQSQCPYGYLESCPFDTSYCMNDKSKNHSHRHTILIVSLLIISIVCSLLSVLYDKGIIGNSVRVDAKLVFNTLSPIANSVIAAILCAIVMDIPSRMMEYQHYFIGLLSSSEYLKSMNESELVDLRYKVTQQLHWKNVPNIPESLIDLDKKVLEMLKEPYFNSYDQTINVCPHPEKENFLLKNVTIEYTGYNPYSIDHIIKMDIGFGCSLLFDNDEVTPQKAEELLRIDNYEISVDGADFVDMRSCINILVSREPVKGFLYNGIVRISSNSGEDTIDLTKSKDCNNPEHIKYQMEEPGDPKAVIEFTDQIHVRMKYQLTVPKEDNCFTKRLRHPVKYFNLDYSVDPALKCSLKGQLIGTLLDQNDVSIEHFDQNRRLKIQTRNWLLSKNGAMIVHCNES